MSANQGFDAGILGFCLDLSVVKLSIVGCFFRLHFNPATSRQAKGHDTSQHVLACFGGAGGQHACSIARALGMKTVFIHK